MTAKDEPKMAKMGGESRRLVVILKNAVQPRKDTNQPNAAATTTVPDHELSQLAAHRQTRALGSPSVDLHSNQRAAGILQS